MIWNSKNSTYYDKGKKAYGFGDEIPDEVLEKMGQQTLEEYVDRGLIADEAAVKDALLEQAKEEEKEVAPEPTTTKEEEDGNKRQDLLERARGYGLKPHYRAGIEKLEEMIEDHEALQALKVEALALGIDPSDDVDFAELTELVNEKKAENELDS